MYQVGTVGPTGTGAVAVPIASPQPQEGFLRMALCEGCVTPWLISWQGEGHYVRRNEF